MDATSTHQQQPHVIFFFDVNKTIIMHDPIQGKDLFHIVNDLLAEACYGQQQTTADGDLEWKWNGVKPTSHAVCQRLPQEITYGNYLRKKFPLKCADRDLAQENKLKRRHHRRNFTAKGHEGHALAQVYDSILQQLRVAPNGATKAPNQTSPSAASLVPPPISSASLLDLSLVPPTPGSPSKSPASTATHHHDEEEYHYLLPAFFTFLRFAHKHIASFQVVFRTFGQDLPQVIQEFNLFCEGRHPFVHFDDGFRMDGHDGKPDRRITNPAQQTGCFFRCDSLNALVLGTLAQPERRFVEKKSPLTTQDPVVQERDRFDAFYNSICRANPSIRIFEGLEAISGFFDDLKLHQSQQTLAFRDYYPHWFMHQEDAQAGKLLIVNDAKYLSVFFDDNILDDDPHIVDVREKQMDQQTGQVDFVKKPFDATKESVLFRVEPIQVIQDVNYFIDRVRQRLPLLSE